MKLMMTGSSNKLAGVMIPIPQYPLYTATIAEYNAYTVSTNFRICVGSSMFKIKYKCNYQLQCGKGVDDV